MLPMILDFIRGLPDELVAVRDALFHDLHRDCDWLVEYRAPAHVAWICLSRVIHHPQDDVADGVISVIITNDDPDNPISYTVSRLFAANYARECNLRQTCESFQNDIDAITDTLRLPVKLATIQIARVMCALKFDPAND